ncbi:Low-molecular weight cobalt-containing nitrile hydratase subunit alpha [Flavobacterium beibuense]|uniref:Low-molecular weight cobalt-containing nitrile hydratase subunit alpha n=2 Tax=Flavobacterium beibuense TaxID=657326 RepID=A0A444WEC8_9FLAO|nr:Low-molecular weight cobalt-containing nitrile hydratase subunit alpha [Flavobacterium beibuense]
MMNEHHHGHDHTDGHEHDHTPIVNEEKPGYYEILEISIRELLIEKGIIKADEVRKQIEVLDSRSPVLGSKLVVKAWLDPDFRVRLIHNGNAAAEEMGISIYDNTEFTILEDTPEVHHVIVCTLCSCYPRPILGLPPDWYKSKEYRARTVKEPRAVLAEFGTVISDDVQIVVQDSTASQRYMVLPLRPQGTENFTEAELESLVTRDTMIGVTIPRI